VVVSRGRPRRQLSPSCKPPRRASSVGPVLRRAATFAIAEELVVRVRRAGASRRLRRGADAAAGLGLGPGPGCPDIADLGGQMVNERETDGDSIERQDSRAPCTTGCRYSPESYDLGPQLFAPVPTYRPSWSSEVPPFSRTRTAPGAQGPSPRARWYMRSTGARSE
jgi:hypothetical protein